jgi:hypothetical protein
MGCPTVAQIHVAVAAGLVFQNRTVWSSVPAARVCPLGLKATARIPFAGLVRVAR